MAQPAEIKWNSQKGNERGGFILHQPTFFLHLSGGNNLTILMFPGHPTPN